ncbi:hypothetical protein BHF68_13155 [Desulfuribacillus alkaliarsenatis]|uniref:Major facilitator superfamily (MFS) profile domain-containing protein n=2 Tax=Desulfuribacillus alkaliarsenatis TaxID=766136 RepID=A0A1E5G4J7_9FIRM|nr:hypothetical protein BHF68_13155 [Desulfuribacillus alkaliarsenatis]
MNKVIPLLSLTIFFSANNNSMFNVALPDIAEQFQLLPSEISWVVIGFIVLFALSAIITGKLADMYPVKYLITLGLLVFNVGLILGFLSDTYWMLLLARYLQACGSGAIPALMMIVATRYAPPEDRGKALGIISSSIAFSAGIGYMLGGIIIDSFGWNYLFLVSLLSIFSIYLHNKWLPFGTIKAGSFDKVGAFILILFITSVLIAINQLLLWLVPACLILLALFIWHVLRVENPFIKPQLFINQKFRRSLLTTFLVSGTFMAALFFFIPLMLRELYGLSSAEIGLMIFPAAISAAILGSYSGKFADRVGSIPVVYAGTGILLFSFFLLSVIAGESPILIGFVLAVSYVGFATFHSSIANTVSQILPPEQIGVGMGIFNLTYYLSGAVFTAISGKALDYSATAIKLNPFLANDTAAMYSNLGIVFICAILLGLILFHNTFKKKQDDGAFL